MRLKRNRDFAKELFRIGAIKVDTKEGFRLALHDKNPTAPPSPFYINLRTHRNKGGPLKQVHVDAIAMELLATAARHRLDYDAVAGIPRAGTPFAKAIIEVAKATGSSPALVNVRKVSAKSRAMRAEPRTLEHRLADVRRVLIVDDLITRADTKLTAIKAVRDAGYEVAGVVVYLDREQGGIQELRKSLIPVFSVLKINEMLDFYGEEGMISKGDLRTIKTYLRR